MTYPFRTQASTIQLRDKVMKHVKQWLVAGLALGMAALTANMPLKQIFLCKASRFWIRMQTST